MKATLFLGAVAMLSAIAIACGNDKATPEPSDGEGGAAGILPAVGMIAPGQFLTWNGQQYELVNLLFEEMVDAGEFEVIGEAPQTNLDVPGDSRIFSRTGDASEIYTFVAANDEDPAYWLAWRLVS